MTALINQRSSGIILSTQLKAKNYMRWEWALYTQGLLNRGISGLSVMVKKYCISKFNLGINIVELKNYLLKEKIHCKDVSFQKVLPAILQSDMLWLIHNLLSQ